MRIRFFVLLACLIVFLSAATLAKDASVKDFGAKGDGITDDYAALVAAAKFACANPGTTLVYPAGKYEIKQYKITGGPRKNAVTDVTYDGCKDVTISGYDATIDVNGSFKRTGDYTNGKYYYSYENEVTPFRITNSDGVTVKGFELNGNVQAMTRDNNIAEGPDPGIWTGNCSNTTLLDLDIHHFASDGIYIGWGLGKHVDHNVTIKNVHSHNNARLGLAMMQVNGARIENSEFVDTGKTGGSYGYHMPGAGVDIEPNAIYPNNIDEPTGNIVFEHDTFAGNVGFQMVTGVPHGVTSVVVNNCTIDGSESAQGFGMVPSEGTFTNNTFTMGEKSNVTFFGSLNAERRAAVRRLVFRGNKFYLAKASGLTSATRDFGGPVPQVVFDQNVVTIKGSGGDSIQLQNASQVTNNKFVVSGAGKKNVQRAVQLRGSGPAVSGNTFGSE